MNAPYTLAGKAAPPRASFFWAKTSRVPVYSASLGKTAALYENSLPRPERALFRATGGLHEMSAAARTRKGRLSEQCGPEKKETEI
ncbi:MAG: hypothetical protein IJ191_02385 [Treponema sp.]|nr:hypothetical protein [Treponema sp.]